MKASYNWLKELTGIQVTPDEMAERLTRAGLEVEGIEHVGEGLEKVLCVEVRSKKPHPTKERLNLVTIFDGKTEREVVCGAPNVPGPGATVLLADVGTVLPGGMAIEARDVGGIRSVGMLASEKELGIGADGDGIFVMADDGRQHIGKSAADVLGLRDAILEISLTPNRPDCLGHIGIARELCALFNVPFVPHLSTNPSHVLTERAEAPAGTVALETVDGLLAASAETGNLVIPDKNFPMVVPVHIAEAQRCARYVATVFHRVAMRPSPFWLRYRLHTLGQRTIDNVVDTTNYIMLEQGHPIHAFDLAKLEGQRIEVRLARAGEKLALLDGTERVLHEDDLVIADATKPVALAGVMGGAETAVSATTTAVLLEVAWFDPRSVRRTSRRHGIHTDSSHRFERGVDHGHVASVVRRASSMLTGLARAGVSSIAVDAQARTVAPAVIPLTPAYVRASIGDESIPELPMRSILEGLGCSVSPAETTGWRVVAPTHRPDLTRSIDLVEEIARVRGYDLVPSKMLRPEPSAAATSQRHRHVRAFRKAALAASLHEAVNFTFLAPSDLANARVDTNALPLINPLSEERSVMRTSLIPGLLANISRAARHQRGSGRIFEIGKTYRASSTAPAEELLHLGIAIFGAREVWMGEGEGVDFFDGKGAIEQVVAGTGLTVTFALPDAASLPGWAHPKRAAHVLFDGVVIGTVAEAHPDVCDAHDLAARPILAELSLEALLVARANAGPRQVAALPRFQPVTRDFSLEVPEHVAFGDIEQAVTLAGGALVTGVHVFDVYRGPGIAADKKSIALRITYRDPEATLTDKRVEEMQTKQLEALRAIGATLRA